MRLKASVTIFLSLVITVVIVVVCTVIESARISVSQMEGKAATYMAVESVFAGYGKQLYQDYGILLAWEQEPLGNQVTRYMQDNINMADLDDLREGADFGLGINCENQSFHVKGAENLPWGMKDRLSRIFNPKTGKAVMLAFDHGFIMGPTSGLERIDLNIVPLIEYADCLMCTRGILQSTIPANTTKPICLRSDAGTSILTDLNDNVLIDIEDAIRMNVSAMAVMLAIGDEAHEAKTVANLYKAVDKASRYNIPVMGVTAVGKQMARDARYFGLASRICAENGANIVKTYYCEGFEKVAAACPVPVVIAGGKKLPEKEALELCYNAINDGAAGVDMGRNVFQSTSPVAMIQAVHAVVHQGITPDQGYELFRDLAK